MAVNKKTKALYNKIFDGTETKAANAIITFQEQRLLKKYAPSEQVPPDYAKAYKAYWKQFGIHASPMWGWYYAARNGNTDVRYIPHTLFYTKIDQYFNSRKLGYGFNDKNYYSRIFNGIKQPETVIHSFGKGIFSDAAYCRLSAEEAFAQIVRHEEVICKPSQESGSGRDIIFWRPDKDGEAIKEYLNDPENGDYIVQKVVKQHPALEQVHPGSVNTVRICSLLMQDGVHILSSCLRMGTNDSRIDNVTAGGISCGIGENGEMQEYAYHYFSGERTKVHPQGFVFSGKQVPSFDKAVELVKKAHPVIGHFRLVSWDIAIDSEGEAVLIEANMRKGGINLHQFSNGPLFGELTEKILGEVFSK